MQQFELAGSSGNGVVLTDAQVTEFAGSLRGQLLREGDPGYDEARTIWNAMIDKRPALIARCAGAGDVTRAVDFARRNRIVVSVRGGGHNIAGNAVCHRGLMIDLSLMKSVQVDPQKRTAQVEPGVTLAEFDEKAQSHGLATPLGINSTTGVAGLTLGGGFGWLTRKYGMTVDNLLGADVITADGQLRHVSANENPDLFWGIRGGGGNFGVVTRFEYQLYPVGPEIFSGLLVYSHEHAETVLKRYREVTRRAPVDLTVWVVLRKAPPLPFLPEHVHGKEVVVLAVFYLGDADSGQKAIQPLEESAPLVGKHVGPTPYTAWQKAFDPLLTPGARNYWKSHDFKEFSDDAIRKIVQYSGNLPTPHTEIFLGHIAGKMNSVPPEATAYHHRNVNYVMNVHGRWDDRADDERGIRWAREFFQAMTPYSLGSVYVNFMTADEQDRVEAAYGQNYDRLVELKNKYDSSNLFCMNQNIKPVILEGR
ncbi:MAG: FAD-binding oxidoreductase [Acidobacteria bacterium]|nr:MAG: FAD-binding oxidoreductase [Acidobacteriota bacterium]